MLREADVPQNQLPYKPVVMLRVMLFYSTVGLLAALLGIKIVTFTKLLLMIISTFFIAGDYETL